MMTVWVLGAYALMSGITFVAYGLDKRAAGRGQRRTPERTLHVLDVLGGFPGGFLAQRYLRHKNRKVSFQIVFWLCVLLHAAAWGTWWYYLGTRSAG